MQMYSSVQRTPSINFKLDDESHHNYSKSSMTFDYSISNQKHLISNSRTHRLKDHSTYLKQQSQQRKQSSHAKNSSKFQIQEDTTHVSAYYKKSKNISSNIQNKLKTEEFQFIDFEVVFDNDDGQGVREFIIPEATYEGSNISNVSRPLRFDDQFNVEETMKMIQIDSKKNLNDKESAQSVCQMSLYNFNKMIQTREKVFESQITISNDPQKTEKKPHASLKPMTIETTEQYSTDKQNNKQNEFEEVISFGPVHSKNRVKKYKALHTKHFITKDFQNNSSIFEKSKPIMQAKRRAPLKSIENIVRRSCQDKTRCKTKKKPIINPDLLLVSTINKMQKPIQNHTNRIWSNPIPNKKSSSLDVSFNYDNMFKTNAFRETLKSTTLENWKKKYHMKIQQIGEKKTVAKKHRDNNIFENLFIRA